jgi:hypothetical protein
MPDDKLLDAGAWAAGIRSGDVYCDDDITDLRLANRYFGQPEIRNRGCGGQKVGESTRDRRKAEVWYNRGTASAGRFQARGLSMTVNFLDGILHDWSRRGSVLPSIQ